MAKKAAKKSTKARAAAVKMDGFVEKLQGGSAPKDGAHWVAGFVGKPDKAANVRLYLSPEMDWYLEFPKSAVIHTEPLSADASPLGGSSLWIEKGTTAVEHRSSELEAQMDFIEGEIGRQGLTGTGVTAASLLPATTSTVPCVTFVCVTVMICVPITYSCFHCTDIFGCDDLIDQF